MKIRSHSESHLVELDDGRWQISPGDIDLTLNWNAETEIVVMSADDLSSHVLVGGDAKVRVIAADGESWPVREVASALKEG